MELSEADYFAFQEMKRDFYDKKYKNKISIGRRLIKLIDSRCKTKK